MNNNDYIKTKKQLNDVEINLLKNLNNNIFNDDYENSVKKGIINVSDLNSEFKDILETMNEDKFLNYFDKNASKPEKLMEILSSLSIYSNLYPEEKRKYLFKHLFSQRDILNLNIGTGFTLAKDILCSVHISYGSLLNNEILLKSDFNQKNDYEVNIYYYLLAKINNIKEKGITKDIYNYIISSIPQKQVNNFLIDYCDTSSLKNTLEKSFNFMTDENKNIFLQKINIFLNNNKENIDKIINTDFYIKATAENEKRLLLNTMNLTGLNNKKDIYKI